MTKGTLKTPCNTEVISRKTCLLILLKFACIEAYTPYGKLMEVGSHILPLQETKLSWNYMVGFKRLSLNWINPDWIILLVNGQRANNWAKNIFDYNRLREIKFNTHTSRNKTHLSPNHTFQQKAD